MPWQLARPSAQGQVQWEAFTASDCPGVQKGRNALNSAKKASKEVGHKQETVIQKENEACPKTTGSRLILPSVDCKTPPFSEVQGQIGVT